MKIDAVEAHEIKDTRGKPTVEVALWSSDFEATDSVPSGKSTGSHEAKELREADGGVDTAIGNVNGEIAELLKSREWSSPDEIDDALIALDGTSDKSHLGANAILAVSIAAQRLFAEAEGIPLWRAIAKRAGMTPGAPRLFVNVINGGAHADFKLPFQEHLLVAEGRIGVALPAARAAFERLGSRLGPDTPMGDEGGYAPTFERLEEPFELLAELAAEQSGLSLAIDAAATELRQGSGYRLLDQDYSPADLLGLYRELVDRFALHSIEDPFSEDADNDFAMITAALGTRTLIIGDDLTVTNPARIRHAIEEHAINAVLIKPNQIGSVKEAIEAVRMTHANGWATVCSHRSGETMDTFIADFAYGVGAHGIKAGGFGQQERLVKYERLLEIEREAETV